MNGSGRTHGFVILVAMVLVATLDISAHPKALSGPEGKPPSLREDTEDARQRALATIDYVAEMVPLLAHVEDQISNYLTLGEVLARSDRPRARDCFRKSFTLSGEVKAEEDPTQDPQARERIRRQKSHKLRVQVLRRIAGIDGELAKALLRELKEEAPALAQPPGATKTQPPYPYAEELAELAEVFLEPDPKTSVTLAEESLEHGVAPTLPSLLSDLHQTDPQAADQLFDKALNAASRPEGADMEALLSLASYAFQGAAAATDSESVASIVDQDRTTRLLEALASVLAKITASRGNVEETEGQPPTPSLTAAEQVELIRQHLPLFQEYSPETVPALVNVSNQLETRKHPGDGARPSSPDKSRQSEAGIAQDPAESVRDPRIRDQRLARQAVSMAHQGQTDEAKRILTAIRDEAVRRRTRQGVFKEAAIRSLDSSDFMAARQFAQDVTDLKARTAIYTTAAEMLADGGDRDFASTWLAEAFGYLSPLSPSNEKAAALFNLTQATVPLDPPLAFQMAQSLVTTLNHLKGGSTVFDGRRESEAPGLSKTPAAESLGRLFHDLGRLDFDQALYLAAQLHEVESRIAAELALCQSVL